MPRIEPGTRVVAIRDSDESVVNIFGFGTYVGEVLAPDLEIPNPKIELDDGKGVVWGYQCWWALCADEAALLARCPAGTTINVVPLPELEAGPEASEDDRR